MCVCGEGKHKAAACSLVCQQDGQVRWDQLEYPGWEFKHYLTGSGMITKSF